MDKEKKGLKMKYFVLNPNKDDDYGYASRKAIKRYAEIILDTNPDLSMDLLEWLKDIVARMGNKT